MSAGAPKSWALWLPDLRARKNEVYSPGRFCLYRTPETKLDREDVIEAWRASEQEKLAGSVRLVLIAYRSPEDDTGDVDHWVGPLMDHLSVAGAWTDDSLVWASDLRRRTARTVDEAGLLIVAWEEYEHDECAPE